MPDYVTSTDGTAVADETAGTGPALVPALEPFLRP